MAPRKTTGCRDENVFLVVADVKHMFVAPQIEVVE
jgi:hypothetical protein